MASAAEEVGKYVIDHYMPQVSIELGEIAKRHNITLLFAGLFGSQAKGYAGPESDYDLYVVYHGTLSQYVKVINFDTLQCKNEEPLPPQITFDVPYMVHDEKLDVVNKSVRIQLNFVSFDTYMQEVGRSNLDFRIALDNIKFNNLDQATTALLHHFALVTYDPEKYKHTGYGRASKVGELIKNWDEVRRSEVTDCLYRLFMGWASTIARTIPWLALNKTITLSELIDIYLDVMEDDAEVRKLKEIIPLIANGDWQAVYNQYAGTIAGVIERLIPVVKTRAVVNAPSYLVDRSITAKFAVINKINEAFVEMLLKGGK